MLAVTSSLNVIIIFQLCFDVIYEQENAVCAATLAAQFIPAKLQKICVATVRIEHSNLRSLQC